ncbi:hypothetical protein BX666DRAFT_1258230 [Dichotomocladium elegans]|nr:hypothetical protein BX666DRAFT_1258230 [Dichotomocladium elegans]
MTVLSFSLYFFFFFIFFVLKVAQVIWILTISIKVADGNAGQLTATRRTCWNPDLISEQVCFTAFLYMSSSLYSDSY